MKKNKLAFIGSLIAGLLCLGNFLYKLLSYDKTDYFILIAGVLIIAFGVYGYMGKGRHEQP